MEDWVALLGQATEGLNALFGRAAHYAISYQAGPRRSDAERAKLHRQAYRDAITLESLAIALRIVEKGSDKMVPVFDEAEYETLVARDGTPAQEVPRRLNENLVECVCGKLYYYPVLVGAWGIILAPNRAGVRCPFCGSQDYRSISAHSGDFFNATAMRVNIKEVQNVGSTYCG